MIPKNITRKDILKAIEHIDLNGVPEERRPTKYYLKYKGRSYPPKYVISISNIIANKKELKATKFNGGKEANSYLESLGFEIVKVNESKYKFPYKSYSWTIISNNVFIKEMDKSTFLHSGTGIPSDIREFFNIQHMVKGERKNIRLIYDGIEYEAVIEMDNLANPRSRIIWKREFADLVKKEFPKIFNIHHKNLKSEYEQPKIRFERDAEYSKIFKVEFINPRKIYEDIEAEVNEERVYRLEGKVRYVYSKKYERDHRNRSRAIEIHGTKCIVCGFDFHKVYGELGKGYIEIHHVKPLSTLGEEVVIDPKTDLVPVCSNCHNMIHRKKERVLSIEEMKQILNRG
ncbi:HNH endonuclease [Wukongibacter baidiensis]